ncbi:MAG: RidA family protein [Acidimicrobiales bacterium]
MRAGDFVVCSGQLGLAGGELKKGIPDQVAQAVSNLEALLTEHGAGLGDVVKTTVLLSDIADYAAMNEAYVTAFGSHRPARAAYAVAGLPLGALVEIEAWAYSPVG